MITINRMGDTICGSVNNEQFGVPFTEERYTSMVKLQEKANSVESMVEYQEIIDEFQGLIKVDYKETVESECPYIHVNNATGTFHLKTESGKISSVPMPDALVERILDSMDKKIDFLPLIKMWTRWLRNPILHTKTSMGKGEDFSTRMFNYINATYTNHEMVKALMEDEGVSEEVAIERATTYQVGITVEGLLRTFKVSKEIDIKYALEDGKAVAKPRREAQSIDPDTGLITYEELSNEGRLFQPAVMGNGGDEFYCGDVLGHHIKVGLLHRLPDWSYVNTNDYKSCVKGLHCGGLDYIRGYQHGNTETHNILVDPMNIGAVPDDQSGAIRVLEYFVLDAFSGVNGSIYHSSKYAAESDKAWEEHRDEVIKELGEFKDDIDNSIEEMKSL